MPWEWENSKNTVTLPVSFCRDTEVFDVSYLNQPEKKIKMLNPGPDQEHWKWPGSDGRIFQIPVDVYQYLPKNGNLVRDVIGYISQQYIDTQNKYIKTTLRQIAKGIGLSINGERAKELDYSLSYAKGLTICRQRIKTIINGQEHVQLVDFSFIKKVIRTIEIDGVKIHPSAVKTEIIIDEDYACILDNYKKPRAPIPVAALEKANQSPPRQITPIKNLIYRIAARVPLTIVEYRTETLIEILGLKTVRRDRLQKSVNNIIEALYPIMISDYRYENDKYIISLAGKKV